MKKYLLDSVILIDHFNNISQATGFIKKNHKLCYISAITRAEVLTGFQNEQAEFAIKLLDSFELLLLIKTLLIYRQNFAKLTAPNYPMQYRQVQRFIISLFW